MNDDLRKFLDNLREFFEYITQPENKELPEYLRGSIVAAWPAVRTQIAQLQNSLEQATPDLNQRLSDAGLAGEHLDIKTTGFLTAFDKWKERKKSRWRDRLLAWANIILGSLASVLPAAELIKEYKEGIEQGIKEADEDEQQ